MSTNRKDGPSAGRRRRPEPGMVFRNPDHGGLVRINENGEEIPFEPSPHTFGPEPALPPLESRNIPRRIDGSIAPFYTMNHAALARHGQDVPATRRTRADGWTIERQRDFIERLAETASVTDTARYVGLSRQSARNLYNRSPHFRDAWNEALRAAVSVLAETAFDRAVNGVQEQVWHKGEMVGFREKYNDRLLMFLLRVRDPLNFAPLDDLQGWQRHRALPGGGGEGGGGGVTPMLDRLTDAEQAWATAARESPALPAPADRLDPLPALARDRSHATSLERKPDQAPDPPDPLTDAERSPDS